MLDDDIVEAAKRLLDICKRKNLTVATAESCTAGLVAGTLTEIPGVSSILDRGFITYSNQAKQDMIGVSAATLEGPWRGQPARPRKKWRAARWRMRRSISRCPSPESPGPMAAARKSRSDWCISGPPARSGQFVHAEKRFGNIGRAEVRKQSVLQAFRMLHDLAEREPALAPRGG